MSEPNSSHNLPWVKANIVFGSDGSTTSGGKSAGLSSGADRSRFHQIRSGVDAILIGGESARKEPYGKTPHPLIIISRSNFTDDRQLSQLLAKNPQAIFLPEQETHLSLAQVITYIHKNFGPMVLIEGGKNFVQAFLDLNLIDEFFFTITQLQTGENVFPLSQFFNALSQNGLLEISATKSESDTFYHYSKPHPESD
ncbi:MAG: dihydrofolate reductase family protein [Actinomycetes bacterium]